MPFDATPWRPNALGLSDWALDVFYDGLLPWLDRGGDDAYRFSYDVWVDRAAACPGGKLAMLIGEPMEYWGGMDGRAVLRAAHRLGLPEAMAREIFSGGPNADDLTAAEAAAVVRHMLATGEVDWSVGCEG